MWLVVNHTLNDKALKCCYIIFLHCSCICRASFMNLQGVFSVCPNHSYVSECLWRVRLRLGLYDPARNSSSFCLNAVTWFGLGVKNESKFDPVSLYMCILTGFDAFVSHPKVTVTASNRVASGIVFSDIRIVYPLPILSLCAPTCCLMAFNLSYSVRDECKA